PSIQLLFAMMFAGQLGTMIYLPGMPDIARDLDTSMSAVQSMVATYLAAFAFAQLVMGPLSDRFGRRPVILVGLAVFAVASIVCATAPDITTLLWARVFQATGACATMVVGRAMIRDTSEGVAAAQAMAWLAIAIGIGPAVSPFLGGFIVHYLGWQASFIAIALINTVVIVWVLVSLEETLPPELRLPPRANQLMVTYVRLLRNPEFFGYSMIVAFASGAMQAYLTSVPIVFIILMDVPPMLFGVYIGMMPTIYIIGSYVSRRLSFHMSIDTIVIIGITLSAAGGLLQVVLGIWGVTTPPPVLFAFAISNFGTGLVLSIGYAQALNTVTPQLAGQASALSGFLHMGWGALLSIVVAQLHHTSSLQLGLAQMTTTWAGAATALYLVLVVRRRRRGQGGPDGQV
ncbi:MAG: multidrug effflux MFS transporter, partial [Rhizobiales bacterium]|nr:multidrug effflux MFS transporter [Hyphomicrobiales bacterium]